jgi:hypothetical protein
MGIFVLLCGIPGYGCVYWIKEGSPTRRAGYPTILWFFSISLHPIKTKRLSRGLEA